MRELDFLPGECPTSEQFALDPTRSCARWSASTEENIILKCKQQGIKLPTGIRGRGQTTDTIRRPLTLAPPRHGRQGDEEPRSSFMNRSLHRWFKQLRRLQAFTQRAQRHAQAPHLQPLQVCTWRNICRAPGFRGGFLLWWLSRPIQLHGTPAEFPSLPPTSSMAQVLFYDFRANFRQYEQWQNGKRRQLIAAKAFDHNKLLFAQVKGRDFSPPDHFTLYNTTHIAVLHGATEVELTEPLDLPAQAHWTLQGLPAQITILQPDRVCVDTDLVLAPGQKLVGRMSVSTFDEMEAALSAMWAPIWLRHADTPPEVWERAEQFAKAYLPHMPISSQPWTSARVLTLAKRYKKTSATGPDGWSREDVENLSTESAAHLAYFFERIQTDAGWPAQLTTGFVCPARKLPEAEQPKDYRPIILMPFLYRLWASGSAKTCIPHLSQMAGLHQYGFIPQRRATDLWFLLQSAIEVSLGTSENVMGYNLDLIRCFNNIPRLPMFQAMATLGLPKPLLDGWAKALTALRRRFKIGFEVGAEHPSTSGFPEGCPLSCISMTCFNIVLDVYVQVYSGSTLLTSFVDNLQLVATEIDSLMHGLTVTRAFLDIWGLSEDRAKSYVWSTTATGRSGLRALGFVPRLAAKDLGAQMTFSKVQRVTVADARQDAASHIWGIIRRSCAHKWFKLITIRQAAWPRILHGCENRKMAPTFTSKLRSKAVHALGWRRAGASPWIRWSLMQAPELDPELFQIWCILRMMFRMCQQFPHVATHWNEFLQFERAKGQGPFHSLRSALAILGWQWHADLSLDVGFLCIPLHALHLALIRQLMIDAWDDHVCAQVAHRQDYAGLRTVDRRLSFRPLASDVGSNELLSTIQDGTFFTDYQHAKYDQGRSGICSACKVEDDLAHRCLQCPRYAHIRADYMPCVRRWHLHPPAFQLHGLVPRNEHLRALWCYFGELPDTRLCFFFQGLLGMTYHVFTDGTCSKSLDGRISWVAWSAVLPAHDCVLSSGHLHGVAQTNNRGELCAILSSLHWKIRTGCHLYVWTDSQYCLTNFAYICRFRHVPETWCNRDLWLEALALSLCIDWDTCHLQKVVSHCDPDLTESPMEDWLIRGNEMADTVAKRTNATRETAFHQLLQKYEDRHFELSGLADSQRSFLLAISKFDLGLPLRSPIDPEEDSVKSLGQHHELNSCAVAVLLELLLERPSWPENDFEAGFLRELSAWLAGVDILSAYAAPISLAELVIGFCISTEQAFPSSSGLPGPRYRLPGNVALGALMRPTLAASVAAMRTALKSLFALAQAELHLFHCVRHEVGISFSVPCLVIGFPDELRLLVAEKLSHFSESGLRHARDLAKPYQHLIS